MAAFFNNPAHRFPQPPDRLPGPLAHRPTLARVWWVGSDGRLVSRWRPT